MLDLDLLQTLVCVVDERSFTRAAERVHRTQSTVSQQILRLEDSVGHPLLHRDRTGKNVTPTERGELLAAYARRLLALAQEAEDALASPAALAPVRIGLPEDFDARRMTAILSGFLAIAPELRLETSSGLSCDLQRALESGGLDLALLRREPGNGPCIASWPDALVWVAGPQALPTLSSGKVVSLAVFPHGCIYRLRAIRALEAAGSRWRIAFVSHSLAGIQAAVSSGLAVSVLPTTALLAEHRVLGPADGYPDVPGSELALVAAALPLSAAQRSLAGYLCTAMAAARVG
ncbi:LysR family transcriptional regulator [Rhodoferax sp.]|uniref:LysR family transcriptional regulator n=1 Tax=Rhodoferax sp. TaxID=50421 RepID=UPI0025D1AC91|nr:LysR family transcriptional regulator [Rhodoferax sp.]